MKKVLTAAALVAGMGYATIAADFQPDAKVLASELVRSFISGIILGADVGPYQSALVRAHIESRVAASGYVSAPTPDRYSTAAGWGGAPAGGGGGGGHLSALGPRRP